MWIKMYPEDGQLAKMCQGLINHQWLITLDGFINPYTLNVSVMDQESTILNWSDVLYSSDTGEKVGDSGMVQQLLWT
jgi:hypothetical protein